MCLLLALTQGCSMSGRSGQTNTNLVSNTRAPRGSKPYTIRGITYYPLLSADGFREEGVASWYGSDFHGKQTANGERYDMYGMTAAHKLLPFNTKVKVTNKKNGKSIVVRINDRGPFIDRRVIDLTKTGADRIGMLTAGTAPVKLEVVGVDTSVARAPTQAPKPVAQAGKRKAAPQQQKKSAPIAAPRKAPASGGSYYVQLGAFGSRDNAKLLADQLSRKGEKARYYYSDQSGFWRVQAGPYPQRAQAEVASLNLSRQFPKSYITTD